MSINSEYDSKKIDGAFSAYRTKYLIKSYIKSIGKSKLQNPETDLSINLRDELDVLSTDGKKIQLIEQTVYQAILHFTTCMSEAKEPTIAGDILSYLSGTNGRRTVYGTLTEDSRSR